MSSNKQSAKEKGNASFRSGKFEDAIGQYSAAIFADRTDHTLPLNRAAAYLKLGKYEDAERDCTTSLSIRVDQVKALYRRAQARIGLLNFDEARGDLSQALKLEPKNEAVIAELKKLDEAATARKARPTAQSSDVIATTEKSNAFASSPRRRRVPIEIVEGSEQVSISSPQTGPSVTENLVPVSSRSLSKQKESKPLHAPAGSDKPENLKPPVRAGGGGIFRASGDRKTSASEQAIPVLNGTSVSSSSTGSVPKGEATNTPQSAVKKEALSQDPPLSLFEFNRQWERHQSASERWALLSSIPPSAVPPLFKTSLEAPMLVSILEVLYEISSASGDDTKALAKEYLSSLSRIPRFSTISMFLTPSERNLAKNACDAVGGRIDGLMI